MDITTTLTNPTTWLILTVLHAACWAYAYGIVRRLRSQDPDHGQTAWLVVIGNSGISIALFSITWITNGLLNAIGILVLLLLANLFAGIPMIVEYIGSHIQRRRSAGDLAALTNLLDQTITAEAERYADDNIPDNAVAYYGGRFMLDLQPEPAQIGARAACTQALEHIESIDDLLDIIWPDHRIAATTESCLSSLHSMIQSRLATIEDNIAAQSPISIPKSPIPSSPHNATLSKQDDAPS